MAFRIIRNDITKVHADAIVNTANPKVTIGDGVDLAIYEAAGKKELLRERERVGYLNVGEVAITKAFKLNAKYIIHSSGPSWIDGTKDEERNLRKCYDSALKLAYENDCESIAFPLMSTGSYGFPKELGMQIALEAFNTFLLKHEIEIILVVFEEYAYKLSGKIFDDVRAYIDSRYVDKALKKEYKKERVSRGSMCIAPSESIAKTEDASEVIIGAKPIINQESGSFSEYLQNLIKTRGMKNSEVYAAANLTKQYFSKLINGKVTPSKAKILSLAVGMHLDMDEATDFLRMSGYALSPFSEMDKIFEYFIENEIYDIYKIDILLFDYGLPTLVND